MASNSMQPGTTENKPILTPVTTLEGHRPWRYRQNSHEFKFVSCISYFPDGKQMISGSRDKTIRRWDLREGKEIKEAREVCDYGMNAVGVSRDGRWVVTSFDRELKVSEVETGIMRTFHIGSIQCIDISADSALVAGGSYSEICIWSLDTGKLVAGPFKNSEDHLSSMTALRLSEDSPSRTRKLAVSLNSHLQVWDIQAQKLLVQKSTPSRLIFELPVFWTTKDKSIIAASSFTDDFPVARTIYEYDASTLKTVGAPFKHDFINGLALSSDCVLLASSSCRIIKLWAFESRQLLASFEVSESPRNLVFSPGSRQLAYTAFDDAKIYICNIPANILASIGLKEPHPNNNKSERSCHVGLLDSDATSRPVRRKPIIPAVSPIPRPLPARDPHARLRFLRKLFSSSFRTDAVRTDEPRDPLDFSATLPLPRALPKHGDNARHTPAPFTIDTSPTLKSYSHRLSTWWPLQTNHASPAIVDVPLAPGRLRYAAADAPGPEDDLIRDEDYIPPPPSPNPGSRPWIGNSGQHGRSRFCFCF